MENGKWTVSPDQSLLLRYGSQGLDEDEEEGEESRVELTLDAIDADINRDESVRSTNAFSGHQNTTGLPNANETAIARKATDLRSGNTGKPAAMTLKEQEKNIELKVKLQTLASELKQYKRLLQEATAAIKALQAQKNCDLHHGMTKVQEEEFRNALAEARDLKASVKQLSQRIESLEQELQAKDLQSKQLQSRLGDFDAQAGTIEGFKDQIRRLQDQLSEHQQSESRLLEKSRVDEGWEMRCRELEQELSASLELRSELEQELSLTRSDRAAFEEEANRQIEQYRDEVAKGRIDTAELTHQLEDEREQMRQMKDTYNNDMNALSERWTLDRQSLKAQIAELSHQLEAQSQDLMAWRGEDTAQREQEIHDLVAELEDKNVELAQTQEDLQNVSDLLQERDIRIAELQDRIEQLEISRLESDAVHGEVIAMMKSTESVPLHDFQLMNEELLLIEERNRSLESQLIEADKRLLASEKLSRDRDANGYQRWEKERQRMEREFSEQVDDLQERLAVASDQISELNNELDERDKQSKELEERYEEMELKLNSDLEATTAELMELRQEVERIKANRVEKNELLHSRSDEVDRLNVKTRKLNVSVAALEDEKEQLETALRDRATTIAMLKSRLTELELQVSKKQRDDDTTGETTKSDLVERNSLLLTVLQHLESILGGDSKLDNNVLPKPSANFPYFSNHLISRLKSLSKLFILFEKKGKELEDKSTSQLVHLKKQLDIKLKQLDGFEASVRAAADRQRKWREQVVRSRAENEELLAKQQQLNKVIADLKARTGSSERVQDYEARCKHVERKLQIEKTRAMDAEERWNARLRELEKRTKDAEERVKRERQGAKEKVAGLLDQNNTAQKAIENLQRKNDQLQELVDIHNGNLSKGKLGDRAVENSQGPNSPFGSQQLQNTSHARTATELGLSRMNDQLRNELEQRSKVAEKEREKTRSTQRELETANAHCYKLQQQLVQRENAIKNTLSRIEMLRQRREVAESLALCQATEDLYRSLDVDDAWDQILVND
ncbi:hypothetical protein BGZ80_002773 [Entomortierella chlamydospora]|uniref:Uncharacterized protein n=1 Tax=Entomortierella chlamydospora TaxID=101097 RepID=A0A9P6T4I1_9FUNG|nr:hypothetical protein BGZ80_002773 [Entomortierella chlamydospora]